MRTRQRAELRNGATVICLGDCPTWQGAYNQVRDDYRRRIEEIEKEIR